MGAPRKYSDEVIKDIVTLYRSGVPRAEIALKHNMRPDSVYSLFWRWNKEVEETPVVKLEDFKYISFDSEEHLDYSKHGHAFDY